MTTHYLTTAIPYVNSAPHIGFALEIVQADVLARHHRHRGRTVRFQTGSDDNSLKNVRAAEAEGVTTTELVARNAKLFENLRTPLALSFDDFIRTGADPRHRPGVHRLWRACEAAGDLYKRHYEGDYCVGCEQFYAPGDLAQDGTCPEHGTPLQHVAEENWFFRLSRYADRLTELIENGTLRIHPEERRNEVLAFLRRGLRDLSVSRGTERAHGWGVGVPGDPDQVVYVWFDALGNYITALDYGTGGDAYGTWWRDAAERTHVIGKGIILFHAVYWPAILLSAGEPLPTTIHVHDYLTVDGRKIGKSLGNAIDPVAIAGAYGTDALRWWLLRDVPRVGDADFTVPRLIARTNEDLANGIGNLVNRVATVAHRYRDGVIAAPDLLVDPADTVFRTEIDVLPNRIDEALRGFGFREAAQAVVTAVDAANRYVETARPWALAKEGTVASEARLDTVLALLVHACRVIGGELTPFLPELAAAVTGLLGADGARVGEPRPLFPRIEPR